jgi:hypothetical protein
MVRGVGNGNMVWEVGVSVKRLSLDLGARFYGLGFRAKHLGFRI